MRGTTPVSRLRSNHMAHHKNPITAVISFGFHSISPAKIALHSHELHNLNTRQHHCRVWDRLDHPVAGRLWWGCLVLKGWNSQWFKGTLLMTWPKIYTLANGCDTTPTLFSKSGETSRQYHLLAQQTVYHHVRCFWWIQQQQRTTSVALLLALIGCRSKYMSTVSYHIQK